MRTILAAAACLFLGTGAALATADGADFFEVTNVWSDDVLFLRASPTSSAKKVGAIPYDGKGIINLGCMATSNGKVLPDSNAISGAWWCKVRYGSQEGWAYARYLREGEEVKVAQASPRFPAWPPSVAKVIDENKSMCEVFKPGKGFAKNDVDLNGDGIADWMIDYGHVECDGSSSIWCGSGGCTLQVLVSTGPGNWELRFEESVQDYKVVRQKKGATLRLGLHGSACNRVGTAPCFKDADLSRKQ